MNFLKLLLGKKKKTTTTSKTAKPAVDKKAVKSKKSKKIGKVVHYYGGIKVVIIKFNKDIRIGKEVRFKGTTTDFKQVISSMQFDHKDVKTAKKGKQIGIKVKSRVRVGDGVFEE
jgi:putative protease